MQKDYSHQNKQYIPSRPPRGVENKAADHHGARSNRGLQQGNMALASKTRMTSCTCGTRPGMNRCSRHGFAMPGGEKWRRNYTDKEILRRALRSNGQNKGLSLRWWNFQPTPSRLSNMSMAS